MRACAILITSDQDLSLSVRDRLLPLGITIRAFAEFPIENTNRADFDLVIWDMLIDREGDILRTLYSHPVWGDIPVFGLVAANKSENTMQGNPAAPDMYLPREFGISEAQELAIFLQRIIGAFGPV